MKAMKTIREVARFFVGGLFIFSGLIKVNDPVGTQIKLEEYFEVFAYDFAPFFEWFIPAALFLSVFLSVLEVVLGIALLLGYRMQETAWVLLGLIVFFTFLTFYSAYFNKVTDCGCFGDAIKLTPWQSFYKDVILMVLIAVIFWQRKNYQSFLNRKVGHGTMIGSTLILVVLAVYAILHLPYIDFRAYAVNNNIPQLMQPSGELKYEYIMEKNGEEFVFDQYPTDKSYTFKAMELTNPEVQPKITDLAVWNDEGDFTDQLLTGNKLLIITHNVEKASLQSSKEISSLISRVKNAEAWVLTSSNQEIYQEYAQQANWELPFFYADATVVKTMIRSNPGIMLLQNGIVRGKWHYNDVPEISKINQLLN
jgi:uncharacterized membrane protein YphA (DoxX/SURF4 family)